MHLYLKCLIQSNANMLYFDNIVSIRAELSKLLWYKFCKEKVLFVFDNDILLGKNWEKT